MIIYEHGGGRDPMRLPTVHVLAAREAVYLGADKARRALRLLAGELKGPGGGKGRLSLAA